MLIQEIVQPIALWYVRNTLTSRVVSIFKTLEFKKLVLPLKDMYSKASRYAAYRHNPVMGPSILHLRQRQIFKIDKRRAYIYSWTVE